MKDAKNITRIVVIAALMLATASIAAAQNGTFTNYTMVWDGITRYYQVYRPYGLPANAPMLMMLHETSRNLPSNPPIHGNYGWLPFADANKFLLVKPAATYDPQSGQWNWNAYYLDPAFPPPPPDDSGFLRQLIVNLTAKYNLNPKRIYVAGFSSGAMMAERVGVEISDLVAAIVPVAGQIVGQPTLPITLPANPVAPVAVQEWHGTLDTTLPPCNHGFTKYSGYAVRMATVDETFNYWAQGNVCTQFQTTQPLCLNGSPNPSVTGNDATGCSGNAAVQFIWEENYGHAWLTTYNAQRWAFMAAHQKP
jgi:poly(3-hydroxybutyrate) depolymerase